MPSPSDPQAGARVDSPANPDISGFPAGDVLEVLVALHGQLREAIGSLGTSAASEEQAKTLEVGGDDAASRNLLATLLAHERMEADVLWPLLRREIPDGPELVGECSAEEKPLRLRLEELAEHPAGERVPPTTLRAVAAACLAHMAHEERELTVRLPEALDSARLHELGDLLREHLAAPPDASSPSPTGS